MKVLDDWLYRYMAICMDYLRHHRLAVLDALAPSQGYKPALQRVSTPVVPRASAGRHSCDMWIPWI
jgi:hypothetical protein